MPAPQSVRDLVNDPDFGNLSPEAKAQVYSIVSARDQEFSALSADAQNQIRSSLLGTGAGHSQVASSQSSEISPELARAATEHAAELRTTPNPLARTGVKNLMMTQAAEEIPTPKSLPESLVGAVGKLYEPAHKYLDYVTRGVSQGIDAVASGLQSLGEGVDWVRKQPGMGPTMPINLPRAAGDILQNRNQLGTALPGIIERQTGEPVPDWLKPGLEDPKLQGVLNTAGGLINEQNLPFLILGPMAKTEFARGVLALGFGGDMVPRLWTKYQDWQSEAEAGHDVNATRLKWGLGAEAIIAALVIAHGSKELKSSIDADRPITPEEMQKFVLRVRKTVGQTLQDVVEDPDTGKIITKNPPGSPLAQTLAAERAGTTNPKEAVENLAQQEGLKPPDVKVADVPVSKTEGDQVTLAPDAGPAESAHEVEHLAENQDKGPAPPEGPGAKEPPETRVVEDQPEVVPQPEGRRMSWLQSPEAQQLRDSGQARMEDIIKAELDYRFEQEGGARAAEDAGKVAPDPGEVAADPKPSRLLRLSTGLDTSLKMAGDIIFKTSPATFAPTKSLKLIYRWLGEQNMARAVRAMDTTIQKAADYLGRFDDDTNARWIDAMAELRPDKIEDPTARMIHQSLRGAYDEIYKEILKYRQLDYVPGYTRRMWKVLPNNIDQLEDSYDVNPNTASMEGNKKWTKERQYKFLRDGINDGGVPWSYNPIDIFNNYWNNVQRFISARRMLSAGVADGQIKFVRDGEPEPVGLVRLDNPIARTGLGEYWFDGHLAQMIQNAFSTDYFRDGLFGPYGRSIATFKNLYTQLELGFSGFHFGFITNEATASDIGHSLLKFGNDGVRQGIISLARGDLPGITESAANAVKGLSGALFKLVAGTPVVTSASAWRYFNEGGKLMQYVKSPEEFMKSTASGPFIDLMERRGFGGIEDALRSPFEGGASIGVSQEYKLSTFKAFEDALARDNYVGAALRSVPGLADWISGPLFDHYIPNIKMGFYLNEYGQRLHFWQKELDRGYIETPRGREPWTKADVAREAWRTTENRFGEMNFDTLFWNRTFQSMMQVLFRSVTWRLGSVRQYSDAARSQLSDLWRNTLKSGEFPRLTPDMAWGVGALLTHMTQSAVVQWMFTHTMPTGLDWFFPRVGGTNNLGQENRVATPTYMRDLWYLTTDPGRYVQSGLSGPLGKILGSYLLGQDYYGEKVQGMGEAIQSGAPTPIGFQSYSRMKEAGAPEGAAALSMIGFTKAPRGIGTNPDEQLILDHARKFTGPAEPEDFQRRRALSAVLAEVRRNGVGEAAARKAIEKLHLSKAQTDQAVKDSQERDPFVPMIHRMSLRDVLKLTDELSDAGLKRWADPISQKIENATKGAPAQEMTGEDLKSLRPEEIEAAKAKISKFRARKRVVEGLTPVQIQ